MNAPGAGAGGRTPPRPAVPPERRTRRDLATSVIIAVVMVAVASTVLLTGSAARSEFAAAEVEQPVYGPADERPTELRHLWSHESADTGAPLTTRGNLVTVDPDGTLVGRDAGSGDAVWSYSHAGRLCSATFYADILAAAFDGAAGCSDVTALDPTTQQYSHTRQSAFPAEMSLRSTWRHTLAFSTERLEIWRDDLVRTVEYGAVDAPQEPAMQPRTGCSLISADLTDERFAVSERCPGDDSVRLTISETVPEDNRIPEDIASDVTGADGVWVLGIRDHGVLALVNRGADWAVEWFETPDRHTTVLPLPHEPRLTPTPDTVARDHNQVRWFDGAATHAFDMAAHAHDWTVADTSGPGLTGGWSPDPDTHAGSDWVVLPIGDGFAVVDHADGREQRRFEVHAGAAHHPTGLSQVGDILYERRDGVIHAYKLEF